MPQTIEPSVITDGEETHPAFGLVSIARTSCSPPGAVLFDSDVRHQHIVTLRIKTATRKRSLGRDSHFEREMFAEVEMSEAQWASVVSSVGMGTGVPCTITSREGEQIPGLEPEARLAQSLAEVRNAATQAFAEIQAAQAAVEALDAKAPAKDKRAAAHRLKYAILNATPNVEFAGKQLTKHAEDVVARSKADIEAMTMRAAQNTGVPIDQVRQDPQAITGAPKVGD